MAATVLDFNQTLLLCLCLEKIRAIRDPVEYFHANKPRRLAKITGGCFLISTLAAFALVSVELGCPKRLPPLTRPFWSQRLVRCPIRLPWTVHAHNAGLLVLNAAQVLFSFRLFRQLRRLHRNASLRRREAWKMVRIGGQPDRSESSGAGSPMEKVDGARSASALVVLLESWMSGGLALYTCLIAAVRETR